MNKDIQTLIEREANSYAVSNIDNPKSLFTHLSKQTQDDIFDTVDSSFKAGAQFALSLFKWRKVEEEMPDERTDINIKSHGCIYSSRMVRIDDVPIFFISGVNNRHDNTYGCNL